MIPVIPNLTFILAFIAGLFAFVSPCVLPLIPSWLCIMGGSSRPIARTLGFILGFSAVFVALSIVFSITFNAMGGLLRYINLVSGIIVIVLGINLIFNFLSFLNYEKRLHLKNKPKGVFTAFLAGCAFGAGWTPCIGPVLTGILLLAAGDGVLRAVFYLIAFSAGLGLPFILAAVFYDRFLKVSAKLRAHLSLIQRICGILLILIGIGIITGHYQLLSALAAGWQPVY